MNSPENDRGIENGPFGTGEFDPQEMDELFDVLSDAQRRCAIHSLCDAGGAATFDQLVGDVARRTTAETPDRTERKEVATSLYHVHLPKLESAGLVTDFDTEGEVRLDEGVDEVLPTLFDPS